MGCATRMHHSWVFTSCSLGAVIFCYLLFFHNLAPLQGNIGDPVPQRPGAPEQPTSVVLNVFFAFDTAKILPQYYSVLDKVGAVLSRPEFADARVQIEGH